jgi:chromatin remodeling complex protein RSC6
METIIQELEKRIATLEAKMTRQEKMIRKMKKDMIPEEERKPRKPSGFAKPTYLSPVLCEFLGVSNDTELARTEVTKRVLAYVKDNNLQNPEAKRIINMDPKLRKLLNPSEDEVVTYFSIQRLMKVHYIKPEITSEPVVVAAAVEEKKAVTPPPAKKSRVKK